MTEIVVKDFSGKKITVYKRKADSISPGSIYIRIQDSGNNAYLDEQELKEIWGGIKVLRKS